MCISSRSKLDRIDFETKFSLNRKEIQFVKHFTYLGVLLDNEMSLKCLLNDVKKKIGHKIFL